MSSNYTYKNDEIELVELGQFIRDVFPQYTVNVDWFIVYEKIADIYIGYKETISKNYVNPCKRPDIMIIDKKTKKIITLLELDGGIHTKTMFSDTEERNKLYKRLQLPCIVITKAEITTSVFDKVHQELSKILE